MLEAIVCQRRKDGKGVMVFVPTPLGRETRHVVRGSEGWVGRNTNFNLRLRSDAMNRAREIEGLIRTRECALRSAQEALAALQKQLKGRLSLVKREDIRGRRDAMKNAIAALTKHLGDAKRDAVGIKDEAARARQMYPEQESYQLIEP